MDKKHERSWERDTLRMRPIRNDEQIKPSTKRAYFSDDKPQPKKSTGYIVVLAIIITLIICLTAILMVMSTDSGDSRQNTTDGQTQIQPDRKQPDDLAPANKDNDSEFVDDKSEPKEPASSLDTTDSSDKDNLQNGNDSADKGESEPEIPENNSGEDIYEDSQANSDAQ